jgi:hypothetical protein
MPLTITALIVDPDGKPLAQHDAQLCIFTTAGLPKVIGAARTDDSGKLTIMSKWLATADYQPRLQLMLMRGLAFAEASENPATFAEGSCDFGKVTFNPNLLLPLRLLDPDLLAARVSVLEAERDTLSEQHAQALAARTAELNVQRQAEKDALTQQLTQQHAQALAARTAELNVQRQAEKDALTQQLAQQQSEVLAAKNEALAAKDEQLQALGQQLAAATSDNAPETTIEDLASSTAEQLQRVRQTLQDGQSGLRLGKVALQLKVMAGRTGGSVALPQTRQIEKVGAGALGSLDLAFIPETAAPAARPQLTAPRVLGYTEALARRKLAERRLGVELVYRLVTSAAEHGRVVLQRPEPAAPVAEGAVVLIAIGRQAEHDPRPS